MSKNEKNNINSQQIREFINGNHLPTEKLPHPVLFLDREKNLEIVFGRDQLGNWVTWVKHEQIDELWKKIKAHWSAEMPTIAGVKVTTGLVAHHAVIFYLALCTDSERAKRAYHEIMDFLKKHDEERHFLFRTDIEVLLDEDRPIYEIEVDQEGKRTFKINQENIDWFRGREQLRIINPRQWDIIVEQRQKTKAAKVREAMKEVYENKILPQVTNSDALPTKTFISPFIFLENFASEEQKNESSNKLGQWVGLVSHDDIDKVWKFLIKNWKKLFPDVTVIKAQTSWGHEGQHLIYFYLQDSTNLEVVKKVGNKIIEELSWINTNSLQYISYLEEVLRKPTPIVQLNKFGKWETNEKNLSLYYDSLNLCEKEPDKWREMVLESFKRNPPQNNGQIN